MSNIPTPHPAVYGIQVYAQTLTRPHGQRADAPWPQSSHSFTSWQSEDQVTLSQQGRQLNSSLEAVVPSEQKDEKTPENKGHDQQPLENAELRQVQQLKQRDTEVRAHEQAHLSTAGQYAAGGPSFSYQTGPNGKRYAVGGSVPIDMAEESTPAATIMKMRTVKRAALAPANPSAADRQIAARAGMQAMKAIQELQTDQVTESQSPLPVFTDQKESTSPESSLPDQAPSKVARAIMSAAYRAMASSA